MAQQDEDDDNNNHDFNRADQLRKYVAKVDDFSRCPKVAQKLPSKKSIALELIRAKRTVHITNGHFRSRESFSRMAWSRAKNFLLA